MIVLQPTTLPDRSKNIQQYLITKKEINYTPTIGVEKTQERAQSKEYMIEWLKTQEKNLEIFLRLWKICLNLSTAKDFVKKLIK